MVDVRHRDVDGGWAWVALMASVVIVMLLECFIISVGIFQVEFLDTFPGSKGFVALIGAVALSGMSLMGPVAGIINNLLTPRITIMIGGALMSVGLVSASFSTDSLTLLVLFGLVAGLGTGLCYTPSVTVISSYFHKYRVVANGVTLASPGIGIVAVPYLLRWLIEDYGWRFAMSLCGCFMAQSCVLASLFFPHDASLTPSCCTRGPEPQAGHEPEVESLRMLEERQVGRLKRSHNEGLEDMVGSRTAMHVPEFGSMLLSNSVVWTVEEVTSATLRQRLRRVVSNRFVWVICLNQLFLWAGFSVDVVHFPAYAQSVGITIDDLPTIFTVYGIVIVVCRVGSGFIFSRCPLQLLRMLFCLQVLYGLVLLFLPLYGGPLVSLVLFKLLVGMTYAPSYVLLTPVIIHYVGLEDLSVTFGATMMSGGIGLLVAPPLGGLAYDVFGNYGVSYYLAGSAVELAALSLLLVALIKERKPPEQMDARQEAPVLTSQKEADCSSVD